jgi:hypothetical protein
VLDDRRADRERRVVIALTCVNSVRRARLWSGRRPRAGHAARLADVEWRGSQPPARACTAWETLARETPCTLVVLHPDSLLPPAALVAAEGNAAEAAEAHNVT